MHQGPPSPTIRRGRSQAADEPLSPKQKGTHTKAQIPFVRWFVIQRSESWVVLGCSRTVHLLGWFWRNGRQGIRVA
ncbi:unnamed protein product [Sphagnum tenellum]